ncbi:DEAD/DEAH box helicase [Lacticigenium naphthae]|uniref:DEAD/DEAH box helicase n=1 Tax=Lacticigenium naphthae TaxID=515351 RepID=UPI00040423A9|nr:DEAD/DEAH box helicase [Lacticigenium naphthae]
MIRKQFFPETTIQHLASNEVVMQKGTELYDHNKVSHPYGNNENNSVHFEVQGEKKYDVSIRFYKNGVAKQYHCNCPLFERYQGACEHVVASMLKLNTLTEEEIPLDKNTQVEPGPHFSGKMSRQNDEAINFLLTQFEKETQLQTAHYTKPSVFFEYTLTLQGNRSHRIYSLTMKAGNDHLYVLKDIKAMIKDFVLGHTIDFGKRLTYSPEKYAVPYADQKFLKVLYDIVQVLEATNPYGQVGDKKELIIPPQFLKMVLTQLEKVDAGFIRIISKRLKTEQRNQNYHIQTDWKKLPLQFHLRKVDERSIEFGLEKENEELVQFHSGANIILIADAFYFLSAEAYRLVKTVWETVEKNNFAPLRFNKKNASAFFSSVLGQLSQWVNLTLDETLQAEVIQPDLHAQLYLDWNEETLHVRPVFRYGSEVFYPLENETQKEVKQTALVIRNLMEENRLLSLLHEQLPLATIGEGVYQLDYTESVAAFLYESLPTLKDQFELFLTSEVDQLFYSKKATPRMELEANEATGLLDVSFQTDDLSLDELKELMQQLRSQKKYYRLNNGKLVNLKEEGLQQFNESLEKMDMAPETIDASMHVPLVKGLAVAEDLEIEKGERFKSIVERLTTPIKKPFALPIGLEADLRPYQKVGYNWMRTLDHYGFGGILADDMGLGKTVQTITFLLGILENSTDPALIICPSSVLYNWEAEFAKFAPGVSTILLNGPKEERSEKMKEARKNGVSVWITSYPLIQRDTDIFEEETFQTVILDEAQNVKNDAAKTTKAVKALKTRNKFALSGTPIENNLQELYTLFSIVQPGIFTTKKKFLAMRKEWIRKKITPFILRRIKKEVLQDLPEKTETTELIDLYDSQKRVYRAQLALIRERVEGITDQTEFQKNRMHILAGMTRLRQICCDPHLVLPDYEGESSKLDRLMEYLEEARLNGKRVVLFSQFTSMLAIIRKKLDNVGVDYHYLDGSTPNEDRLKLTTRFNTGEKDLFLISLKAGGTGLNLTGGDTVILYDSWWNPAVEQQAADRVHRYGQKKSVQVIRMITKGTIEEKISLMQAEKRELMDTVIQTGETKLASLSREEILSLLSSE